MESGWFKQDEHGIQARTCLPQLMHIRVRETLGDIGLTEPEIALKLCILGNLEGPRFWDTLWIPVDCQFASLQTGFFFHLLRCFSCQTW